MKNVLIRIDVDNAAFGDDRDSAAIETARILGEAARKILEGGLGDYGLFDINGNRVGGIWYGEHKRGDGR